MSLNGELIETRLLSSAYKEKMYNLMECYYENIKAEIFEKDLMEKDTALLLKDSNSVIQGFTTIKTYYFDVDNMPVRIVFSGDTIINKEHWGDLELHRMWIRAVYSNMGTADGKAYWLLISKGYKTYRFLPVYFHKFYPCFNISTPQFEKKIMDSFCAMKYPQNYDPDRGVIYMKGERDFLKEGIADITDKRLKDPHINFFTSKNPGHIKGDELVCLAELSRDNMKTMTLRYLERADATCGL